MDCSLNEAIASADEEAFVPCQNTEVTISKFSNFKHLKKQYVSHTREKNKDNLFKLANMQDFSHQTEKQIKDHDLLVYSAY